MRIPIFRHLDNRVELFGLSLVEICFLAIGFIGLSELLTSEIYGRIATAVLCGAAALVLRYLHARFGSGYFFKFIRFIELPDSLHARIIRLERWETSGVTRDASC